MNYVLTLNTRVPITQIYGKAFRAVTLKEIIYEISYIITKQLEKNGDGSYIESPHNLCHRYDVDIYARHCKTKKDRRKYRACFNLYQALKPYLDYEIVTDKIMVTTGYTYKASQMGYSSKPCSDTTAVHVDFVGVFMEFLKKLNIKPTSHIAEINKHITECRKHGLDEKANIYKAIGEFVQVSDITFDEHTHSSEQILTHWYRNNHDSINAVNY